MCALDSADELLSFFLNILKLNEYFSSVLILVYFLNLWQNWILKIYMIISSRLSFSTWLWENDTYIPKRKETHTTLETSFTFLFIQVHLFYTCFVKSCTWSGQSLPSRITSQSRIKHRCVQRQLLETKQTIWFQDSDGHFSIWWFTITDLYVFFFRIRSLDVFLMCY